jgi:DNA polymerase III epsilon subunit-like protein
MKILVFDTETSGLPLKKNASITETEEWPYILQLSFIVYDDSENKIIQIYNNYIKQNINISKESTNIHGITRELIDEKGVDINDAMNVFDIALQNSDIVVGHNISFDKRMYMVEAIRRYRRQYFTINGIKKKEYCTMKNSTNICKIERVNNKTNKKYYKYPTLKELHTKLFNEFPTNLHNSLIDVFATLRCYIMIKDNTDILKNKNIKDIYDVYKN